MQINVASEQAGPSQPQPPQVKPNAAMERGPRDNRGVSREPLEQECAILEVCISI